ncbi:MAG: class I SAM-dependent methyltransferase, partial [Tepidiformaceae bacterium]
RPPAATLTPLTTEIIHRADSGRSYQGIPMHAAGGVHEYALKLVRTRVAPGSTVLDVGTGSGALSARLHDAGFAVTACDISGAGYAAEPPLVIWDATGESLPRGIAEGTLDCVCAIEVIEHMENPLQALRNFRSLLKPGGLLVVSTPNVSHPRSRLKFLLRGEPSYFGPTEYFSSGHRTILPDWMLQLHAREAGFEELRVTYAGLLGLSGAGKLAYTAMAPLFAVLGMQPKPRTDDGCVTFITARRPA